MYGDTSKVKKFGFLWNHKNLDIIVNSFILKEQVPNIEGLEPLIVENLKDWLHHTRMINKMTNIYYEKVLCEP